MQAERNVQEMAAAAAAARQEKAELEARLRQQENIYATDTAWLTAQTQEVSSQAIHNCHACDGLSAHERCLPCAQPFPWSIWLLLNAIASSHRPCTCR